MFKFNKSKNLLLALTLFSFISNKIIGKDVKVTAQKDNIITTQENKITEQQLKISNMLTALQSLADNIEIVIKEFEQISEIHLNKTISAATINEMRKKEGKPLLSFSELTFKVKPVLANHFDDPAIFGEILELSSSIILKKSQEEMVKNYIENIKTIVNKNFKITNQKNEKNDTVKNILHLNKIYEAEIIQKFLKNSKENLNDFKNFLKFIINGLFAKDSISQKSLIDVIDQIDVLF